MLCSLAASIAAKCESFNILWPSDITNCINNLIVNSKVTSLTLASDDKNIVRKNVDYCFGN